MSKRTPESGAPIGVAQAVKDGVQAVAPGLSLSKIIHDVGSELKRLGAQGASELAAGLFRADAFVMAAHVEQDNNGLASPGVYQARGRGGRGM
ncbi:unnamed protein product [Gemmata massiliana]|uniref:Uncharacterized protein n=1 Tax=Gemmata massiliana TaxID=1210884 RepID=A0A6P2CXQ2_9BACT|nr:hypothetical protein [Gemmata massiliana]VTR92885.1 unnamed protein product [Gemmata massiliana]